MLIYLPSSLSCLLCLLRYFQLLVILGAYPRERNILKEEYFWGALFNDTLVMRLTLVDLSLFFEIHSRLTVDELLHQESIPYMLLLNKLQ